MCVVSKVDGHGDDPPTQQLSNLVLQLLSLDLGILRIHPCHDILWIINIVTLTIVSPADYTFNEFAFLTWKLLHRCKE
jgi:hypothetical protein